MENNKTNLMCSLESTRNTRLFSSLSKYQYFLLASWLLPKWSGKGWNGDTAECIVITDLRAGFHRWAVCKWRVFLFSFFCIRKLIPFYLISTWNIVFWCYCSTRFFYCIDSEKGRSFYLVNCFSHFSSPAWWSSDLITQLLKWKINRTKSFTRMFRDSPKRKFNFL